MMGLWTKGNVHVSVRQFQTTEAQLEFASSTQGATISPMVLSGWKEIAAYLHCGIRTAQRWETAGLPVSRPVPGRRGVVVASSEDLDLWSQHSVFWRKSDSARKADIQHARELRAQAKEAREQLQHRVEALRKSTDLLTSLANSGADPKSSEFDFLHAELSVCATLCRIAARAHDEKTKNRNRVNARKAYDTVVRFSRNAKLTGSQMSEVKSGLESLTIQLRQLGEKV